MGHGSGPNCPVPHIWYVTWPNIIFMVQDSHQFILMSGSMIWSLWNYFVTILHCSVHGIFLQCVSCPSIYSRPKVSTFGPSRKSLFLQHSESERIIKLCTRGIHSNLFSWNVHFTEFMNLILIMTLILQGWTRTKKYKSQMSFCYIRDYSVLL